MIETYREISGIVVFELSGSTFCINLDDVYLIKKIDETGEGNMPEYIKNGYIRINNSDIILIDLTKYFDLPPMSMQASSRIIIINHFIVEGELTLRYGFIADRVNEIIALNYCKYDQILNFTQSENGGFLEGKILFENRELLLPNFSRIGTSLLEDKAKYSN